MVAVVDCHMHMVLDGENWKAAIGRHKNGPDRQFIRQALEVYKGLGVEYLRDGGDRWGVGKRARELAKSYGITYRTPLAPLCQRGHYGGFIGKTYRDFREYRELIRQQYGDSVKDHCIAGT